MFNPRDEDINKYKTEFDAKIKDIGDGLETQNPVAFESVDKVLDAIDPEREHPHFDDSIAYYMRNITEPASVVQTETGAEIEFTKTKFEISDLANPSNFVSLKIEVSTDGEPHLTSVTREYARGDEDKLVTRTITETFSPDGYVVDRLDVTMSGESDKIAETHWESTDAETRITQEYPGEHEDYLDDTETFPTKVVETSIYSDSMETHTVTEHGNGEFVSSSTKIIEYTENGQIEMQDSYDAVYDTGHTFKEVTSIDEDGTQHKVSHEERRADGETTTISDRTQTTTYSEDGSKHEITSSTTKDASSETIIHRYEFDSEVKGDGSEHTTILIEETDKNTGEVTYRRESDDTVTRYDDGTYHRVLHDDSNDRKAEWDVTAKEGRDGKYFVIDGEISKTRLTEQGFWEDKHYDGEKSKASHIEKFYSNDGEKVTEVKREDGVLTEVTVRDIETENIVERTTVEYDKDSDTYRCETRTYLSALEGKFFDGKFETGRTVEIKDRDGIRELVGDKIADRMDEKDKESTDAVESDKGDKKDDTPTDTDSKQDVGDSLTSEDLPDNDTENDDNDPSGFDDDDSDNDF